MPTDLAALRRICAESTGTEKEANEVFWHLVEQRAVDDVLCYGLWVHGGEHPVLEALAMSRHAWVIAGLLEKSLRGLVVTPPEHGKTTLIARWYVEWWLGRETERAYRETGYRAPTALLVSNTAGQAQKRLMSIAATIEANRRYKRLFPHVKPAKSWGWTKEQLYLERPSPLDDPSLQGSGCPGPIQGGRVGLIVVDDPVDQQDARSETTLQTQIEFHQGVLNDRLLEGAQQVDILTRWSNHRYDIAKNLLEASDLWSSVVMPCYGFWEAHPEYGVTDKTLWPAVWPEKRLEQKRLEKMVNRELGPVLWQLAYLCQPVNAEGNMFRRAWFQYGVPADWDTAA